MLIPFSCCLQESHGRGIIIFIDRETEAQRDEIHDFSDSTVFLYGSEMNIGCGDNEQGVNQWTGVCLLVSCGIPKPTVQNLDPTVSLPKSLGPLIPLLGCHEPF